MLKAFETLFLNPFNKILVVFLWLLLSSPFSGFSQNPKGVPFIKNYTPIDYGSATDNWAIAQDQRGVMYFGNAGGILEYDGLNWKSTSATNNSIVRSIAIDKNGTIYIGAVGDFGYLEPNTKGALIYKSLLDKIPEKERDFTDVWKTYATPEGIYFQTFTKLFLLKNNTVQIWKPKTSFHFSFLVNNTFYINEREQGLKSMSNGKLKLVNGGDQFIGLRIYSILPYSKDQLLIATREKGLVIFDKNSIKNNPLQFLDNVTNQTIINDQVYGGVELSNGFAFATLQNGILILDHNCNIVESINKKNGLRDNIVNYIQTDKQKNLWAALGNGLSHIEISSPLRTLNDAQGLNGSIQDITKHKGKLYVASSLGVFVSENDHFIPVEGITTQAWALKKLMRDSDTILLAASEEGIIEINNLNSRLIREGFCYSLCQSKKNTNRLFAANPDGVSSLRYENGRWIDEDYLEGIDTPIRSIVESNDGNLWLGTPYDGVIRVTFNTLEKNSFSSSWNENYTLQNLNTTNGLPDMNYNIPYQFMNDVVFATSDGVYRFNEKTDRFQFFNLLDKDLRNIQVYRFAPKDSSAIWMFTVNPNKSNEAGFAVLQKKGVYSWYSQPFLRISEREIHTIFPDNNDVTWMGGPDGLLRYNAQIKKDFVIPFNTLIKQVNLKNDSVIFLGNFYNTNNGTKILSSEQTRLFVPNIIYEYNSLNFEFVATSYGKEEDNKFNFYLEGHDKSWSGWNNKTNKEYTDLKEGDYVFRVKGKNIYGVESIEATYTFTILPPWYRTILAYVIYIISFICFIYLIVRLSVRRLVKAKNELERVVKERTAEVVAQKHVIEEKHKEITDSINYAERIQRSFLATEDILNENLKDHFVFFQPKDIVSGDFYWAASTGSATNKKFVLVTADSTGHGVPGAIMSLLNITSLEKAIEHYTEPAEILNDTRNTIIKRLKKDGSAEGGKDGMDASLISFDFKNNKLSYAAANNPIWIVRASTGSATNELIELAPDKMPVGKHEKDQIPFTQHTVELQKGDVVYALTDGFPDQFGGPKGKKFMSKNLKELLISIVHLPMGEQKEVLKNSLNNWKGELEQVDDVCLIGVKI